MISIDSSSVFYYGSLGADVASVTSTSVTPPGGSLIALAIAAGSPDDTPSISSISDSLTTHLNWTALSDVQAQNLECAIWIADVPSSAPGSFTITVNFTNEPYDRGTTMGICVLTGAAPVSLQNGATNTNYSSNGTPATSLNPLVGSNSFCYSIVFNETDTSTPVMNNQSDVFNGATWFFPNTTDGVGTWAMYSIGGAAGTIEYIAQNGPTNSQYNIAAAEILVAPATPNGNTAVSFLT